MKTFVDVKEDLLEEEVETNVNVWSPNVQIITQKMELVLMAAVTRDVAVREHQKLRLVPLAKVNVIIGFKDSNEILKLIPVFLFASFFLSWILQVWHEHEE